MRVFRFATALALVTLSAGSLRAQFTAVIGAPKTSAPAVAAAQQKQEAARQDSVAKVTLTNMKAWVDSAAGTAGTVTPMTAADTAIVAAAKTSAAPAAAATAHMHTAVAKGDVVDSTFRNGGRAPNTASPLPLLALLGAASLAAGMALLRRRSA